MHSLACYEQATQQYGSKLVELLVNLIAHQVEHFLNLLDKDHLLRWAGDWPEFEKALDEWHVQCIRLLEVILNA